MEKYLVSADYGKESYPMKFGFAKHQYLQREFENITKCHQFRCGEDYEFKDLCDEICALLQLYRINPESDVNVQCELFINDRRIDIMIYVPNRLCVIVEFKSHLAVKVQTKHRMQGLRVHNMILSKVYERTQANVHRVMIPLVGLYFDQYYDVNEKPTRSTSSFDDRYMRAFDMTESFIEFCDY